MTTCSRIASFSLLLVTAFAAPAALTDIAGLIQPYREAVLSSAVLGKVSKISVKDGARVEADEVLIELDKRSEELEANRRKIVWELKAELEASKSRVENLSREFESTKKLMDTTRSVSKDELAKKGLELKLAEAELEQINRREEIEKLEYEFALEQVRRREIRAPYPGQVVEILPKVGEVCEPRQPMVKFVDASQCYFVANLDPQWAATIKVGQRLPVAAGSGSDIVQAEGVVEFVSPIIDAASGLRRIKLLINNQNGRVVAGSPATLKLEVTQTAP